MKISFEEFKSQIIADYHAMMSGRNLAHIVLDKFTSNGDVDIQAGTGPMFDDVYKAAVSHQAKAFVWWNSNNSDLLKLLGGFKNMFSAKTLSIQAVRSNDYPAMFITLEKQIDYTRLTGGTSVTIVELSSDAEKTFRQWILDKQIFSESELDK